MESNLSCLSSLKEDSTPVYIQPHYKESYRLAIYALVCGGLEAYQEFLKAEQISHLLSEEEVLFILENAELPVSGDDSEANHIAEEAGPPTYFPTESDEAIPDLDLGWPQVSLENTDTSISLLFHPPRQNTPTVKEVVRRQIKDAKQVIAIAMDVFTDADIFKEVVNATLRGVVVYILLDDRYFKGFLNMSERLGIRIQDLKNMRVRTVKGQQYQCRSGVKFNGGLKQKFILVDCSTVLYGTYSYTWSFEKINMSMVLVITGQLVASYDEEFRRLFAQSTIPVERVAPRQPVPVHSPNSSQLSLNLMHMRPQGTHGLRTDWYNAGTGLSRGLSLQERLHQSHHPDVVNMMKGQSYAGDLQRLNSSMWQRNGTPERSYLRGAEELPVASRIHQFRHMERPRFPTDHQLPYNSETSLNRWKMDSYLNNSDSTAENPYSVASPLGSQTALNENQSQIIQDRAREIRSRLEEIRMKRLSLQEYSDVKSPRQSQESLKYVYTSIDRTKWRSSSRVLDRSYGLAESDQNIQRSFNQESGYHGDSINSKTQPDRNHTERGLGRDQSLAPTALLDGHRSTSQVDIKTGTEKKTTQAYDWYEPLSRTTSAANLDVKLKEPSLKPVNARSSGLGTQHSRTMQSLVEIPEETTKGSNNSTNKLANSSDLVKKTMPTDEVTVPVPSVNSTTTGVSVDSQQQGPTKDSSDSTNKLSNGSDASSLALKDEQKPTAKEEAANSVMSNASSGLQHVAEANDLSQKAQTQREEPEFQRKSLMRLKDESALQRKNSVRSKDEPSPQRKTTARSKDEPSPQSKTSVKSKDEPSLQSKTSAKSKDDPLLQRKNSTRSKDEPSLQRKNSIRAKVCSLLSVDDRKSAQKEEKALQRKNSVRSKTPMGSNPPAPADLSADPGPDPAPSPVGKPSASGQTALKGQTAALPKSHHGASSAPEAESHKTSVPLDKSSAQYMNTRKPHAVLQQDRASRTTLEGDGTALPQARREKGYSRFEHFLVPERNPPDRAVKYTAMQPSDKERGSFLGTPSHLSDGSAESYTRYQTQPVSDNKLGRFMQRVGNLINKNK